MIYKILRKYPYMILKYSEVSENLDIFNETFSHIEAKIKQLRLQRTYHMFTLRDNKKVEELTGKIESFENDYPEYFL